ncbi:MerR family transcriptional regulator [Kineococcus endophyticus]|uniref:MerR family transcriptional regulator n=1 Tax=Kineococcus endophyticus TaxID=1181883 RepID=A0ABV3P6S3_9ACTN
MEEAQGEGPDGELTVGRVAELLGVSVRTLHHWESLGLVTAARTNGGYRTYGPEEVARLQRVVRYRELGVPLAAVAELLDGGSPSDGLDALRRQRAELVDRLDRTRDTLDAVDRLIDATERGTTLTAQEQAALFGADWDPSWPGQARERWGDSPQWRQHAERAADRSTADWAALAERIETLEADLAAAFRAGTAPGSVQAAELAERHRASVAEHFDCTYSMHVCLARSYVDDPRFREHYDRREPGLAPWLRAVVEENARARGVDPETAVWE